MDKQSSPIEFRVTVPFYPTHQGYQKPIEISVNAVYPQNEDNFVNGKELDEIHSNLAEQIVQGVRTVIERIMEQDYYDDLKNRDETVNTPVESNNSTETNDKSGRSSQPQGSGNADSGKSKPIDDLTETLVLQKNGTNVCAVCAAAGQTTEVNQKRVQDCVKYKVPLVLCWNHNKIWIDAKDLPGRRDELKDRMKGIVDEFKDRDDVQWHIASEVTDTITF